MSPLSSRMARRLWPGGFHLQRDRDGVLHTGQGVVGVDQEGAAVWKRPGVLSECLGFVVERRHVGMGHGSQHGDSKPDCRADVAGPGEPSDVRRPRHAERRVFPVGASRAEVRHYPVSGGVDHPRGLGREHRLQVHQVDERGLDKLALDERAADLHDRLARKEDLALVHRADAARQAKVAQVVKKVIVEEAALFQGGDVVRSESEVIKVVQRRLQPAEDVVCPVGRKPAEEQAERGVGGLTAPIVRLAHRELVEVGEQRVSWVGFYLPASAFTAKWVGSHFSFLHSDRLGCASSTTAIPSSLV